MSFINNGGGSSSSGSGTPVFGSPVSISAHAGGGQANGTLITAPFTLITVVASNDDSAKLPVSSVGTVIIVANRTTDNNASIYGQTGEEIGTNGTNGPLSLAAKQAVMLVKMSSILWQYADLGSGTV